MKKKFVAVIGAPNAGKSTVIQSLTGCPHKTFNGVVRDRTTGTDIQVIAASPQEKPLSSSKIRAVLRNAANKDSIKGVVMAVQPSRPWSRVAMEEIFSFARDEGFDEFAFVLDPPYSGRTKRVYSPVDIEQRLSSVGVLIRLLDGRRFAHMNAAIIRNTAGLF